MFGKLKGYKTYLTAALAILGALSANLTGDLGTADAAQLIVTALLGATLRNGMK